MYYERIWITYCTLLLRHCLYIHEGVMSGISKSLIGNRAHVSLPYIIQHNKSHQCWHVLNSKCEIGCSHGCWLFSLDQITGAATEHGNYKERREDQRQEKLSFFWLSRSQLHLTSKEWMIQMLPPLLEMLNWAAGGVPSTSDTSCYSEQTGWFCQSISTAKRWTAEVYEVVLSPFQAKKKWEFFYLTHWRELSNCHFSLIPVI